MVIIMNNKIIYNPSIDIKPDKKNKLQTNFIFECTDKLLDDLSSITK